MRDLSAIRGNDLYRVSNGEDDNGCIDDVARLRAPEEAARCVSIGLSERGYVTAA